MDPARRRVLWKQVIERARFAWERGDLEPAWAFYARAHVLSQPFAWPHLRTHLEMLLLAIKCGDTKELMGQIARSLVAVPGSLLGKYPEGNTGRSDVSMFLPMQPPADLFDLLPEPPNSKEKSA